jgi:type I restriction enzyme S subunit
MKYYKLQELCIDIIDCPHSTPNWKNEGIRVIRNFNLKDGNIDFTDGYFVDEATYIERTKRAVPEEGDIIISREAPMGVVGIVPKGLKCCLGQRLVLLKVNKQKCDPFYLLNTLMSDFVQTQFRRADATGSIVSNLCIPDLKEIIIPVIEHGQREVASFFEMINRKRTINNMINDNLEQQMHLIFENMMAKAATHKLSGKYTIAQNLATVVTGKEDANFSVPNGKYKFFTCSNTPLSCDEYAFDASSILIAGNGDFNVKHYSGKFNAYQRTYVLTPDKKYFGLLYLASLYRINSFKSRSSGSIVKFITKSDVENIPVFIPNDRFYLQELNKLIYLQEQNKLENELLVNLRDWLLPMLMNGQATISD